jgi:hypothetical protein
MKKYTRLSCTICQRITDRLVDNSRVVPDKCTITLNCRGRLLPLEYRSNADIASTPAVGLTDWYPRGETTSTIYSDAAPALVDTATGSLRQLVLAVQLQVPPSAAATAALTLVSRADTPNSFKQFTFRYTTTFSTVFGVETASEKKTLSYTAYGANPDIVQVYVNGVPAQQGTGPTNYQIYDGTSTSVLPNTIQFNSAVTLAGTTQVDVVVSKTQVLPTQVLTFTKNSASTALLRAGKGAWENVDSFSRLVAGSWQSFYIFTYDILGSTDLTLNSVLSPTSEVLVVDGSASSVPLAQCFLMFAREPYTFLDRYPDVSARLDLLNADTAYLKFSAVNGVSSLQLVETALTAYYPPARLSKFETEPTIKTAVAGVADQLVVDGSVIVGPDT